MVQYVSFLFKRKPLFLSINQVNKQMLIPNPFSFNLISEYNDGINFLGSEN